MADLEVADVDSDEVRQIARQAGDADGAEHGLEQAAAGLDAGGLTFADHGHFGVQDLVLDDLVQVDVDDIIFKRVMLDVNEEGQMGVDLHTLVIGQLDIDEDVLAGGGMQHAGELPGVDGDGARTDGIFLGLAVKHAGDLARAAKGLEGGAANAGTL
jgi:hypothetical protein